ncbi:hypothetical protein C6503_00070 [Candidatus Poribacteria bacterium]|nr:MAG: hypothetical protein C6503_00070 [Candidatus Poribacteria bacterium]
MDERRKLSIEIARDASKSVLTLSTSIILVTVTFAKEFIDVTEQGVKDLALWSWGLFFASVAFGVWTLLTFAGEIAPKKGAEDSTPLVWRWSIRIPAIGQMLTFLIGLVFVVILAAKAIGC